MARDLGGSVCVFLSFGAPKGQFFILENPNWVGFTLEKDKKEETQQVVLVSHAVLELLWPLLWI